MDLHALLAIEPLSWNKVATALFCGSLIGLERQLRGKPVGMRTSSLIVLGTYLFVALSMLVVNDVADPARVIGQVVTGIGFLGAGVMLAKEGLVVGVTSAATIWVLAAIGVCITVAGEFIAIKMSVVVVIILYGIDTFEDMSSSFSSSLLKKYRNWRLKGREKRWDEAD